MGAELDGYNRERVMNNVEKIYDRTLEIFDYAETEKMHVQGAAIKLAEKRIADIAAIKSRL